MYLSNGAGAYRVYMFAMLQILYAIGFVYEVISIMENRERCGKILTFSEAARCALMNVLPMDEEEYGQTTQLELESEDEFTSDVPQEKSANADIVDKAERSAPDVDVASSEARRSISRASSRLGVKSMSLDASQADPSPVVTCKLWPTYNSLARATLRDRYLLGKLRAEFRTSLDLQDDKVDTDKYMYAALYACVGMLLWKHLWIMHVLVIPVVYYAVKRLGSYFGFWETIREYYDSMTRMAGLWFVERQQALLPSNIRGLYKLLVIVDEKVRDALKGSVDAVATIAVILGLIVFTTCTSIFITIQV